MYFMEKGLNEDESKKMYLGAFIRYEREKEEMTLSFMADIVGITKSFLSDIEHGKKMPADYTLKKIMSVLDIEFHEDVSIHEEALEKMNKMYQLYSDCNIEKMKELNGEMISKEYIYKNSYAFLTYDLIRLVYELNANSNLLESAPLVNKIEAFSHMLTKKEMAIFCDLKGSYFYKLREFDEAEKFYKMAFELATSNLLKAMICYHFTIFYQFKNNQLDSLIYCEQSIRYFNREYNIYRLLHLEIFKGTCYAREGLFDKAIHIYEKVIENAKKNNIEEIVSRAYNNIAWTYLKAKNYEKTIESVEYSLKCKNEWQLDEIYIYIPYSYYKLGEYEECLKQIKISNEILKDSINLPLLLAIQARIENQGDLFVKYIQEYIHNLTGDNDDYEMYLFAYHELLEYYKSINDQENIIHIYDKMMEIINLVS